MTTSLDHRVHDTRRPSPRGRPCGAPTPRPRAARGPRSCMSVRIALAPLDCWRLELLADLRRRCANTPIFSVSFSMLLLRDLPLLLQLLDLLRRWRARRRSAARSAGASSDPTWTWTSVRPASRSSSSKGLPTASTAFCVARVELRRAARARASEPSAGFSSWRTKSSKRLHALPEGRARAARQGEQPRAVGRPRSCGRRRGRAPAERRVGSTRADRLSSVLRPVPVRPRTKMFCPGALTSRPKRKASTAASCPTTPSSGSTSSVVSKPKCAGSHVQRRS